MIEVATGTLGVEMPFQWRNPNPVKTYLLLDNIRSALNVGSIIRTAEGAGIEHLYLCGFTPTPEHTKVSKTALGSEANVDWSYHSNAVAIALALRCEGTRLISLENAPNSMSLFDIEDHFSNEKVALVVGNELTGIDPELLALSDTVAHLPMAGTKGSLNVAVALGIAVYWLRASMAN